MTYFRAIAIIFILMGHTFVIGKGYLSKTLNFFLGGGTFYFVFIAGFLFEYLSYKFEYKTYLKKKFFNIILPFWCITFPLTVIYVHNPHFPKDVLYYMNDLTRFFAPFIFGQILNGPTWFIGMIVIFFIISPIFLKLEKNKKVWYLVLIISIIATTFIPRTRLHLPRSLEDVSFFRISVSYIWQFISAFLYFSSAWLCGMKICRITERKSELIVKNKKYLLTFLFCLLAIIYTLCVLVLNLSPRLFGSAKLNIALLIFVLLYFYYEKISKIGILDKILRFLAEYSYGIFFIHSPILHYLRTDSLVPNGVKALSKSKGDISVLYATAGFEFIVALLGSILLLIIFKYILKKLKVKNTRWFIGV